MNMLTGYKTYIVAGLWFLVGVVQVATGEAVGWTAIADNLNVFFEALGLGALRAGVAKS